MTSSTEEVPGDGETDKGGAFTALYDEMFKIISRAFVGRCTVTEEEPRNGLAKDDPLPRIVVELSDFDKAEDPGTGEIDIRAGFSARILVHNKRGKRTRLVVRNIAVELMALVDKQTWGQANVGPAEKLSAMDDVISNDFTEFESWLVTWEHMMRVGQNVWLASWGAYPETDMERRRQALEGGDLSEL